MLIVPEVVVRTLLALVVGVDNGFYTLGTTSGLLKNKYTRSEFSPCPESILDISEIPLDKEVTLKEAAEGNSLFGAQGYA